MNELATQSTRPSELSSEVREYLQSADVYRKYEQFAREYGIDTTRSRMLSGIVLRALTGADPLEELPTNLGVFFEITQEQVASLLQKIGANILGAIATQVPGLEAALRLWGVGSQGVIAATVQATTSGIDQFIRAFVESLPETLEPRIQHRFERLLQEYAAGQKSRDIVSDYLAREEKTGGVGMEAEAVPAILDMIDRENERLAELVKTQPVELPLSSESVSAFLDETEDDLDEDLEAEVSMGEPSADMATLVPEPPVAPVVPRPPKIVAFTQEDADEVARVQQLKQHVLEAPQPIRTVEDVIERVCKHPLFQFNEPDVRDRCMKIVESRVKDVRDAFHTRAQFEKPKETGGLGLAGRQLSDMTQMLEQAVLEYQALERKRLDQERAQRPAREEKPDEQVVLDERYQALTKDVRKAIDQTQEQQKAPSPPRPNLVRPQMNDVQFVKRLIGPIDELATLSLVEFRRLSPSAQQAFDRILNKVDLLEQQGYEKRVEGIRAWRTSPLHKQHALLSQEALLNNKNIADVIQTHVARGEETLSLDEYAIVMKLNATLRF